MLLSLFLTVAFLVSVLLLGYLFEFEGFPSFSQLMKVKGVAFKAQLSKTFQVTHLRRQVRRRHSSRVL